MDDSIFKKLTMKRKEEKEEERMKERKVDEVRPKKKRGRKDEQEKRRRGRPLSSCSEDSSGRSTPAGEVEPDTEEEEIPWNVIGNAEIRHLERAYGDMYSLIRTEETVRELLIPKGDDTIMRIAGDLAVYLDEKVEGLRDMVWEGTFTREVEGDLVSRVTFAEYRLRWLLVELLSRYKSSLKTGRDLARGVRVHNDEAARLKEELARVKTERDALRKHNSMLEERDMRRERERKVKGGKSPTLAPTEIMEVDGEEDKEKEPPSSFMPTPEEFISALGDMVRTEVEAALRWGGFVEAGPPLHCGGPWAAVLGGSGSRGA